MTDFLNSPFEAHLRTNFVPSDAQCEQIRADLAPRLVQLGLLNERIRELSAERDKLQAYVDSHTALVSYPRRLPVDIVREIFVACLATDRNAVMSAQEAPLLLCRICSAWRAIALTTPSLWTSIHIPIGFIMGDPVERSLALKNWLQLSGALPISISLTTTPSGLGGPPYTFALVEALIRSASRWGRVEFGDDVWAMLIANLQTPVLESIKVSGRVELFRQFHFFAVRSLHARSSRLSPAGVLTLLGRCPQLVSLAFPTVDDMWDDTTSEPVSLPFLKSFTILQPRVLDLQSVGRLLQKMVAPELRQLHIPTVYSPPQNYHLFLSAIEQIPLLDTLLIYLNSFPEPVILETLRSFPNLAELVVLHNGRGWWNPDDDEESTCTPERLLVLLTPGDPSESTVCPNLQDLQIDDFDQSVPTKKTMEEFLRHRIARGRGFRRLKMDFNAARQQTDFLSAEEVEHFRSLGVEVALRLPKPERVKEPVRSNAWTGLPVMKSQSRWGGWD
ncbi:hypothetical protein FB45DRAFT_998001 [Roridomyces roridus]|uniref:F-box domain-containing protein n=1 Tax=Roridomyces roridus TaxID=1738132 RepID=A0AAD7CFK7_9AGAR|nr:hypothetical protein FB45DRAFT_998001 [Roridomyces roridus]